MTERSVFWANHLKAIDAEGISARAYAAPKPRPAQPTNEHQAGPVAPVQRYARH